VKSSTVRAFTYDNVTLVQLNKPAFQQLEKPLSSSKDQKWNLG